MAKQTNDPKGSQAGLIHEQLSYKIRGCIFAVHNKVGPGLREESYQDAMVRCLTRKGIPFVAKPETRRPVIYRGKEVDILEPDFDVDGKIILELKARREGLIGADFAQTLNYVKCWDYRLGILAGLGQSKAIIERLPYSPARSELKEDYSGIAAVVTDSLRPTLAACRASLLRIHADVEVGYTHDIYRDMFLVEVCERGLSHESELVVRPEFMDGPIAESPITPVLVEDEVLVEIRAVQDEISAADRRIMQTHLGLTGAAVGIIACFGKSALYIRGVRPLT